MCWGGGACVCVCVCVCVFGFGFFVVLSCQRTRVFSNACESFRKSVRTALLELRRKEGNVLFNNALSSFYLRLYGVGHMVKDDWATLSN